MENIVLAKSNQQAYSEWQKTKNYGRFKGLQDERKKGELVVPNIKLYYRAADLVWNTEWIKNP